jgi:Flp pilus assembly protein TadG
MPYIQGGVDYMRKKKGQALVEVAIIVPILLLFICGIVDFGRILNASSSLNMVTQESVRLAGLGKSDVEVTQFAYNKVNTSNRATLNVNINPSYALRKPGDYVTVEISYDVKYITPLVNIILPSPLKIKSKSTIRVE